MKHATERTFTEDVSASADLLRGLLWLIWCIVRVPLVLVLAFLEPLVRLLLSAVAVLSVLTGLVYEGSTVTPPIPLWGMLCISVGCLFLMAIYQGLLHLLTR